MNRNCWIARSLRQTRRSVLVGQHIHRQAHRLGIRARSSWWKARILVHISRVGHRIETSAETQTKTISWHAMGDQPRRFDY